MAEHEVTFPPYRLPCGNVLYVVSYRSGEVVITEGRWEKPSCPECEETVARLIPVETNKWGLLWFLREDGEAGE